MKVIFLDFDGVITTLRSHWNLDPDKMSIVKSICDQTGAKIVISSSWRRQTLRDTLKFITDTSNHHVPVPFLMPELVVGITDRMFSFKLGDNKTHYFVPRGLEIGRWLEEHPNVDKYIIIDDDDDMLSCQEKYFVRTATYEGITESDAHCAVLLLNRQ